MNESKWTQRVTFIITFIYVSTLFINGNLIYKG